MSALDQLSPFLLVHQSIKVYALLFDVLTSNCHLFNLCFFSVVNQLFGLRSKAQIFFSKMPI
jgi:hypothetical protein